MAAKIETKSNIQYSFNNCEYADTSILGGIDISATRVKKFNNTQIKTLNLSSTTASRIAGVDASKNVISLDTTTYPSLTELANVKGVTSSIQTQLNGKETTTNKGQAFGYVGLDASRKIEAPNNAGTFTSLISNTNTASRTYTLQDRDGTLADSTDIAGRQPVDPTLTALEIGRAHV